MIIKNNPNNRTTKYFNVEDSFGDKHSELLSTTEEEQTDAIFRSLSLKDELNQKTIQLNQEITYRSDSNLTVPEQKLRDLKIAKFEARINEIKQELGINTTETKEPKVAKNKDLIFQENR
jgi:hypothetical protein